MRTWLLVAALLAAGCTRAATEVVVDLDTDAPLDRAFSVHAVVTPASAPSSSATQAASGAEEHVWTFHAGPESPALPASFSVAPARGDLARDGAVVLTIDAELAAGPQGQPPVRFRRTARFRFTPHVTTRLPVMLAVSCGDQVAGCTQDQGAEPGAPCTMSAYCEQRGMTCGDRGECVPVPVEPTPLPAPAVAPADALSPGDAAPDAAPDPSDAAPDGPPTTPATEWTALAPSADTRRVYVSSALGDDANSGLDPATPVRTLAAGARLLRDGYPDWLLLRRGDVWTNERFTNWRLSGRSETEPLVITSYSDPRNGGDGAPRPRLDVGLEAGLAAPRVAGHTIAHVALVGLHFRAHTRADPRAPGYIDPASPAGVGAFDLGAVYVTSPGQDLLIEDCLIDSFKVGVIVWIDPADPPFSHVRLRRSVVVDSYTIPSDRRFSGGLTMANARDVLVEQNVFDHNGWSETVPGAPRNPDSTGLNFGGGVTGVIVRGNLVARSSSQGVLAREGGVFDGNVILEHPRALMAGNEASAATVPVSVTNNLVLDELPLAPGEFAHTRDGIELAHVTGAVSDNLLVHNAVGGDALALVSRQAGGLRALAVERNVVVDWHRWQEADRQPGVRPPALVVLDSPTAGFAQDVALRGNWLQETSSDARLVRVDDPGALVLAGDQYFRTRAAETWFDLGARDATFSAWASALHEADARAGELALVDPARAIASYHARLGRPASVAAFLAGARGQSRSSWQSEYTAASVIAYFRAGFARR